MARKKASTGGQEPADSDLGPLRPPAPGSRLRLTSDGQVGGQVVSRSITEEMRESYLDYAMSVITSRALPDVRDGLKPVHRRILYAMHELGLTPSAKFRKSAAVVGEVMAKYHPHGDTAIYDTLAKLAQDFTTRYPLIIGQGNFGSVDGDSPAAMRYCVAGDTLVPTEGGLIRMDQLSQEGKETISTQVISVHGQTHTADKWFDSGEHPTIALKTNRGYAIRGSYNHPLLTWSEDPQTGMPSFEWKLLAAVEEGDVVVLDRTLDLLWPSAYYPLALHTPVFSTKKVVVKQLPAHLTEDLAFILGLLVSEGTIKEKEIEFCNSDPELIRAFTEKWEKLFPDCRLHHFARRPSSYGKKPYYTIEIHSQYVIRFLRGIGLEPVKSKEKQIPFSIFRSPKSVVAAFLQAYFEGDGSISFSSRMTELSGVSMSKTLLDQMQTVLLRFGIASTRRYDRYRKTEKLYVRGLREYRLFEKEIGFFSARKRDKLAGAIVRLHKVSSLSDYVPFISRYVRSLVSSPYHGAGKFAYKHNFDRYGNLEQNGGTVLCAVAPSAQADVGELFRTLSAHQYLFDVVTEIREAGIERVYSLRVASECHSYVGNGFINHNTEAKMSALTVEMLRDIEKETVSWRPNYDGTRNEPTVIPAAAPNILLNGTLGIAVGMATNIPPHNLGEVVDATVHLIENPDASTEDLLEFVQGPDFPTGAVAYNAKDIAHVYATGRGPVVVRGVAEITEDKKGNAVIIITSIPYRVNKAELIIAIANLVREKKLEGIRDIRDESTKDTRVVIELKQNAQPQAVLNYLYKHTQLEEPFHYNMVVLVDGVPETLSLEGVLSKFIAHRKDVVTKRTEFDLARAKEREHILLGLSKALDHIDEIIKTIKAAKDVPTAHADLMKKFRFSERQATAILEMRLQKLAGLERKKIEDELKEVQNLITALEEILSTAKKIMAVVKKELIAIKEKYGDERRTKIVKGGVKSFTTEDLVPDETAMLTLTSGGYVKRTNPSEYKKQNRGGVGVVDLSTKDEDFVTRFLEGSTHDSILFFTDRGKVYRTKMYEVPEGKRATKGKSIMNVLPLSTEERVTSIVAVPKNGSNSSFMLVTEKGVAKKVKADQFEDVRKSGIIAMTLAAGDSLIAALPVTKGDSVIVISAQGKAIRFKESDIRDMGRTAGGVRAMRMRAKDTLIAADVISNEKESQILVVAGMGYGKRTHAKEYKIQKRGGSGIKTGKVNAKTGAIIAARVVTPEMGEIIVASQKGQVIRTELKQVPILSRATQGVRVMRLYEGDKIAAFTVF